MKPFEIKDKNLIKNNRNFFYDFFSNEICSKNSFLRNFEKFQIGVFDFLIQFLKNYEVDQFSFLKKKTIFFCEDCKIEIKIEDVNKILSLPINLNISFDDFEEYEEFHYFDFKLENEINLSFLKIDETTNNIKLSDFKENLNFRENIIFKDDAIYELTSFVKKDKTKKKNIFKTFIKIKDNWFKTENYNQELLSDKTHFQSTKNNPIIFCSYQKKLKNSKSLKNIKSKISLSKKNKNSEENKNIFYIPKNFLNKIFYLNNNIKLNIDKDFCEHNKLSPLYEDIYMNVKTKFIKENEFEIDFNKSKKLNKDFIINFEKIENNFTTIKYISESDSVSENIYNFFKNKFFITKKNLDLQKINHFEKCHNCEISLKKFVTKKIFEKALVINLLKRKKEKKFLIDKYWFQNYTSYLLADIKHNQKAKFNFSKNFIKEKINEGIVNYYPEFKDKYRDDLNLAENEFISVNKSLYQFLIGVYGVSENLAICENNNIVFFEDKELEILFNGFKLNFEEKFVFNNVKKKISNLDFYEKMLYLNEKMNSLINFKMDSDFEIFFKHKNEKKINLINCNKYVKKFFRLKQNFDIKLLDQLEFNPCKILFQIFSENNNLLQKRRTTFLNERNESKKLKNKFGYRKTLSGIGSICDVRLRFKTVKDNFFNEPKKGNENFYKEDFLIDVNIASIDKEKKEKFFEDKFAKKLNFFDDIDPKSFDKKPNVKLEKSDFDFKLSLISNSAEKKNKIKESYLINKDIKTSGFKINFEEMYKKKFAAKYINNYESIYESKFEGDSERSNYDSNKSYEENSRIEKKIKINYEENSEYNSKNNSDLKIKEKREEKLKDKSIYYEEDNIYNFNLIKKKYSSNNKKNSKNDFEEKTEENSLDLKNILYNNEQSSYKIKVNSVKKLKINSKEKINYKFEDDSYNFEESYKKDLQENTLNIRDSTLSDRKYDLDNIMNSINNKYDSSYENSIKNKLIDEEIFTVDKSNSIFIEKTVKEDDLESMDNFDSEFNKIKIFNGKNKKKMGFNFDNGSNFRNYNSETNKVKISEGGDKKISLDFCLEKEFGHFDLNGSKVRNSDGVVKKILNFNSERNNFKISVGGGNKKVNFDNLKNFNSESNKVKISVDGNKNILNFNSIIVKNVERKTVDSKIFLNFYSKKNNKVKNYNLKNEYQKSICFKNIVLKNKFENKKLKKFARKNLKILIKNFKEKHFLVREAKLQRKRYIKLTKKYIYYLAKNNLKYLIEKCEEIILKDYEKNNENNDDLKNKINTYKITKKDLNLEKNKKESKNIFKNEKNLIEEKNEKLKKFKINKIFKETAINEKNLSLKCEKKLKKKRTISEIRISRYKTIDLPSKIQKYTSKENILNK